MSVIWLPRWKWTSLRMSLRPRRSSWSSRRISSNAPRPHLERSPPLLAHLHRVDGGVAARVAELLDGAVELPGERLDAGAEDVGKAEQQRQPHALGVEVHRQLVEIEAALLVGVGVHGDVPFRTHAE